MFGNWTSGLSTRLPYSSPSDRQRSSTSLAPSADDIEYLQLSPKKIQLLKRTLHHYSRIYIEKRHYDAFVVSWDVYNLPKPPDDLTAVLPPDSWDQPDFIIVGFRHVPQEFTTSWAAMCETSILQYSSDFYPLIDYGNCLETGGCLLLVYVKGSILRFIRNFDTQKLHGSFQGVACRFNIHQAPICILNVNAEQFDHVVIDIHEALHAQRLKKMMEQLRFNSEGQVFYVCDHPVILFLGCKDFNSQLGAQQTNDNMFVILRNRLKAVDLRLTSNGSSHNGIKRCEVSVDVLRTGVMKMVIETDGGDYSRLAEPEVTLFRLSAPSVNADRLMRLYRNVWRSLKATTEDILSLEIQPRELVIPSLRPYESFTFKLLVKNNHEVPATFSVFCLSKKSQSLVPVSYHSLHHKFKNRLAVNLSQIKHSASSVSSFFSVKANSYVENEAQQSVKPNASSVSIVLELQKKFLRFTKKADRSLHSMLLTTARRSQSNKHHDRSSKYLCLRCPEKSPENIGQTLVKQNVSEHAPKNSKSWWKKLDWVGRISKKDKLHAKNETPSHLKDIKKFATSDSQKARHKSLIFNSKAITGIAELESTSKSSHTGAYKFDDTGWRSHRVSFTPQLIAPQSSSDQHFSETIEKGFQVNQISEMVKEASNTAEKACETFDSIPPSQNSKESVNDRGCEDSAIRSTSVDCQNVVQPSDGRNENRHDFTTLEVSQNHNNNDSNTSNLKSSALRLKVPLLQNGSEHQQERHENKTFDLTRWLRVEPFEGVILGGHAVEITVTIEIKEPVEEIIEKESIILTIRSENCQCDSNFSFSTKILPSLIGMPLQYLENLGEKCFFGQLDNAAAPLPARDSQGAYFEDEIVKKLPVPKELWWILAQVFERTTEKKEVSATSLSCTPNRSLKSDQIDTLLKSRDSLSNETFTASTAPTNSPTSPVEITSSNHSSQTLESSVKPLEIFSLTKFLLLSASNAMMTNHKVKYQMRLVLRSLEMKCQITPTIISATPFLLVLEMWCLNVSVSPIPREYVTDLDNDPAHLLCRAVLLSLPMCTRNFFIALLSLSHHLIRRELRITSCDRKSAHVLTMATIEWLSRILLKDTPSELSIPFISHFMMNQDIL